MNLTGIVYIMLCISFSSKILGIFLGSLKYSRKAGMIPHLGTWNLWQTSCMAFSPSSHGGYCWVGHWSGINASICFITTSLLELITLALMLSVNAWMNCFRPKETYLLLDEKASKETPLNAALSPIVAWKVYVPSWIASLMPNSAFDVHLKCLFASIKLTCCFCKASDSSDTWAKQSLSES